MCSVKLLMLVATCCLGELVSSMSLEMPEARIDQLQTSLRNIITKRSLHNYEPADRTQCQNFVHYPGHLLTNADVLHRVGDGYSASECQQACLETTSFRCVAIQMHKPATCFLTGYRLLNNYHTVHLARTCSHGVDCFSRLHGRSAGYTNSREEVPRYFAWSEEAQCLYCMARCEASDMCVGVDVNRERSPTCVFFDIGHQENGAFDLYLKRC